MSRRRTDFESFARFLHGRNIADSTIHNYVCTIRRIVRTVGPSGLTDIDAIVAVFAENKPSSLVMARNAWTSFGRFAETQGVTLPPFPKRQRRAPPAVVAAGRGSNESESDESESIDALLAGNPADHDDPSTDLAPLDAKLAGLLADAMLRGPTTAQDASAAPPTTGEAPYPPEAAPQLPAVAVDVILRHLRQGHPIGAVTRLLWRDLRPSGETSPPSWFGGADGFRAFPIHVSAIEFSALLAHYWPGCPSPTASFPVFGRSPGSSRRFRSARLRSALPAFTLDSIRMEDAERDGIIAREAKTLPPVAILSPEDRELSPVDPDPDNYIARLGGPSLADAAEGVSAMLGRLGPPPESDYLDELLRGIV